MPDAELMETLPTEMLFQVMDFMPPDDLQALRSTDSTMLANVDSFVGTITNDLVDAYGRTPDSTLDASQVLASWAGGNLARTGDEFATMFEKNAASVEMRLDNQFANISQPQVQGMVECYYTGDYGTPGRVSEGKLVEWQADITTYTTAMMQAGRLLDEDNEPVDPTRSVADVINAWVDGTVRWTPPPQY